MAMVLFDGGLTSGNSLNVGARAILETFFSTKTKPTKFILNLVVADFTLGVDGDILPTMFYGSDPITKVINAGCTNAASIDMPLNESASSVALVGAKNVPVIEWGTNFEWVFSTTFDTGPGNTDGSIWGYCITDHAGNAICAEKFRTKVGGVDTDTPFTPEAGATLKITPKIYLGNVGDF